MTQDIKVGLVLPRENNLYYFRIVDETEAREYFEQLEDGQALDRALFAYKGPYEQVLQEIERYIDGVREVIGKARPYGIDRILELMD